MTFKEHVDAAARAYLEDVLATSSSVIAAARRAGVSRSHLYKLAGRLGVPMNKRPQAQNRGNSEWQALR